MKINKAIKNLIAGREDCGMIPSAEYTQTIDLAIEALKFVQDTKIMGMTRDNVLLQGETLERAG